MAWASVLVASNRDNAGAAYARPGLSLLLCLRLDAGWGAPGGGAVKFALCFRAFGGAVRRPETRSKTAFAGTETTSPPCPCVCVCVVIVVCFGPGTATDVYLRKRERETERESRALE